MGNDSEPAGLKKSMKALLLSLLSLSLLSVCGLRAQPDSHAENPVDALKITVMGSSVPWGAGAKDNKGYMHMYADLLKQRHAEKLGADWKVSNRSIGGNNTLNILDRWERDFIGDHSRYVIYALSLGNEGIHEHGQVRFDQFRDNMLKLIAMACAQDKIPVVTNNYTREDFNEKDYAYIKRINLLIHQWDVPSVNLLGAIDDGGGHWAKGYQADGAHPNTEGHEEFFYAMVPSLFDALKAGKPVPERQAGTALTLAKQQLAFVPENRIHPFTLSFDVKTSSGGTVASFATDTNPGLLTIAENTGALSYQSPDGKSIVGKDSISDGEWHTVTLTHYFARGITFLYVDGVRVGELAEKLHAQGFCLGDAAMKADYRELFFYRSAMNDEEVALLHAGKMLKSSLELYAPLDGQGKLGSNPLVNFAQSLNDSLKLRSGNGK